MDRNSHHLDDAQLEQIVAYLDGELSPAEAAIVESRLAEDATMREEMQSIERAWSALDALPATQVDDRFSKTTMELVVGTARRELADQTQQLPRQRRSRKFAAVMLALASMALGLLFVRLATDNPNRSLLADLPAIAYVDVYSQFREVEFLRMLDAEVGERIQDTDYSDYLSDELFLFQPDVNIDARRQWIASLDEDEQASLRARYNRFARMTAAEQQRIRSLHEAVVTAHDRDRLLRVLVHYKTWLAGVPSARQFELRSMPRDERVQAIAAQQRREANNPWIRLTPDEARRIDGVLQEIRAHMRREIVFPGRADGRGEGRGEGRGQRGPNRSPGFPQQFRQLLADSRDTWEPNIIEALSPEHRQQFTTLDPHQQQQQIVRWIMQDRGRSRRRDERRSFADITQQELERFFVEDVSPTDKERLLAQPRDQVEQELKRMYIRHEFGDDNDPSDREPPGPGFPPPRGRRDNLDPHDGFPGPSRPPRDSELAPRRYRD